MSRFVGVLLVIAVMVAVELVPLLLLPKSVNELALLIWPVTFLVYAVARAVREDLREQRSRR